MPTTPVVLVTPLAPDRTGNGLAMRAGVLLEALSDQVDVTLVVVPVAGPGDLSDWARHRARCSMIVDPVGPANAREHTIAQLADPDLRMRLAATEPLPQRARLAPPTLAASAAGRLDDVTLGASVVVMREYLAPFGVRLARRIDAGRLVVDLDDDAESLLESLGHVDEAAAYGRLARAWLGDADLVTAASHDDAHRIAARYGLARVGVLPNAVRPPAHLTALPRHDRLLFVGNMTYEPNVDAARRLVTEILPAVRRRVPTARLDLVGPCGPGVADFATAPGVVLAGPVPDIEPWYATADVVVATLRVGSGTRIKVLEALAHGRPLVASSVAVAGHGLLDGVHVALAETSEATAAQIVDLLASPRRSAALAAGGLAIVAAKHTVEVVAPDIRRLVLDHGVRSQ